MQWCCLTYHIKGQLIGRHLTHLYPLLELLEVRLGSFYLTSHQQVRHLNNQVEGPDDSLLLAMVLLHHPTSVIQHLPCLLIAMMSQKKLRQSNVDFWFAQTQTWG